MRPGAGCCQKLSQDEVEDKEDCSWWSQAAPEPLILKGHRVRRNCSWGLVFSHPHPTLPRPTRVAVRGRHYNNNRKKIESLLLLAVDIFIHSIFLLPFSSCLFNLYTFPTISPFIFRSLDVTTTLLRWSRHERRNRVGRWLWWWVFLLDKILSFPTLSSYPPSLDNGCSCCHGCVEQCTCGSLIDREN